MVLFHSDNMFKLMKLNIELNFGYVVFSNIPALFLSHLSPLCLEVSLTLNTKYIITNHKNLKWKSHHFIIISIQSIEQWYDRQIHSCMNDSFAVCTQLYFFRWTGQGSIRAMLHLKALLTIINWATLSNTMSSPPLSESHRRSIPAPPQHGMRKRCLDLSSRSYQPLACSNLSSGGRVEGGVGWLSTNGQLVTDQVYLVNWNHISVTRCGLLTTIILLFSFL